MSIVALQNITFIGPIEEKETILEDLQEMGCLHLRPLRSENAFTPTHDVISEETREAWRFLKDCPNQRLQVGKSPRYEPAQLQKRALEVQRRLEELTDNRDFLNRRIENLRVWGEFKFAPLDEMNSLQLWFYLVPLYQVKEIPESDFAWEIVHRDNRFAYIIVMSRDEPQGMPVERIHIGAKPLSELKRNLEDVELEIDELQLEREGLTRGLTVYERNMAQLEDMGARAKAAHFTHDSSPLFALQAWAPKNNSPALVKYADKKGLAIQFRDPGPDDDPPTLLENNQELEVGEDLVAFYMMPGYRLWDPSMVVLFSFTLFFSMIISDAGYGLVMAAGLLFFRKKLSQTPASRRVRNLSALLTGGTIIWGVLVGSYFGLSPDPGSFLGKLKILDLNNMGFMMKMSVIIGATHIVLANFMDFWRRRSSPGALAPIGWSIVIVGALAFWLGGNSSKHAESIQSVSTLAVIIGFLTIIVFSAIGAEGSLLKRCLAGLMSLTQVTTAFGDVMSYLRLFALGLASASLAIAFNGLAGDVRANIPGIGFFFAIVIILIGHTINFVLCIVSGFVHGLRLNLIEFFRWSIPEEGRPFRAFRKKEAAT